MAGRALGPLELARHTRPWTVTSERWADALKLIAGSSEVLDTLT